MSSLLGVWIWRSARQPGLLVHIWGAEDGYVVATRPDPAPTDQPGRLLEVIAEIDSCRKRGLISSTSWSCQASFARLLAGQAPPGCSVKQSRATIALL